MNKKRKNSRAKGAVGERELSEFLRERGWPGSRRGQQRSGVDTADVIDGPEGWHLECKRVEKLNVWAAFAQATEDAPAGDHPCVAMRRNHSQWLAVVKLETLLGLLRELAFLRARDTTRRGDAPLDGLAPIERRQRRKHEAPDFLPPNLSRAQQLDLDRAEAADFLAQALGGLGDAAARPDLGLGDGS